MRQPICYVALNAALIVLVFVFFAVLIRLGAEKEQTFVDTVVIPLGISVFLIGLMNFVIIAINERWPHHFETPDD